MINLNKALVFVILLAASPQRSYATDVDAKLSDAQGVLVSHERNTITLLIGELPLVLRVDDQTRIEDTGGKIVPADQLWRDLAQVVSQPHLRGLTVKVTVDKNTKGVPVTNTIRVLGITTADLSSKPVAKRVQELLALAGFDPGSMDGIAGEGTANAIRDYQRSHGLEVTGTISLALFESLEASARDALEKKSKGKATIYQPTGPMGKSPLHEAAQRGDDRSIATLLDSAVKVDITDNRGNTPLTYAAAYGHVSSVRLFLDRGADIHGSSGGMALYMASAEGYDEIVEMLLTSGANIETTEPKFGTTSLGAAAVMGRASTVRLLLKHGASKTHKDRRGLLPYDAAVSGGHRDLADMLKPRE